MPLNLPSATLPTSTVGKDLIPPDPKNALTLDDAEILLSYLQQLPCTTVDCVLCAYSNQNINNSGKVDVKYIEDNNITFPINMWMEGTITLICKNVQTENNVPVSVTKTIAYNCGNLAAALSQPNGVMDFIKASGFSLQEIVNWQANWPTVTKAVSDELAKF